MKPRLLRLFGAYGLLLSLLAAEFFAAFLPLQGQARFLLLLPALLMVLVVATGFMGLRREGAPVLMFAASAVLWLSILLGLGLLDPLTRAQFSTPQNSGSASRTDSRNNAQEDGASLSRLSGKASAVGIR